MTTNVAQAIVDPADWDGTLRGAMCLLCFRERDEIASDPSAQGCSIEDIRDAPDRPGRELVVTARRRPEGD